MALDLNRRRFTVEEYYRMASAGIIGEDDRVELIEGEIIEMTPMSLRHAASVALLVQRFGELLRRSVVVWPQNPVRLDDYSEPQPDVVLLRPRPDAYASLEPAPADVLLLVEVGVSSVKTDRRVKMPLYARAGIPEVWLVDVDQGTITAYLDPVRGRYRKVHVHRRGEYLAPAAFPDHLLAVADVLPE